MQTNITANINEITVLTLTDSPIIDDVKMVNAIIPIAKPINLPGHNIPSKYIAQCFVPNIKRYVTGADIIVNTHALRVAHSLKN